MLTKKFITKKLYLWLQFLRGLVCFHLVVQDAFTCDLGCSFEAGDKVIANTYIKSGDVLTSFTYT
jgi:hypothetical protein